MPRRKPTAAAAASPIDRQTSVGDRASYLKPRSQDTHCRLHQVALEATGWCPIAQAWWYPQFACPTCAGRLWENGFCENCTPKTRVFPGDYFEERWDADAGRERGHFVRVHAGPTPAPTDREVAGYLAQLKALTSTIADYSDANGQGTSRRLRGCACDKCVAHFATERAAGGPAPTPPAREPGDEAEPEPEWITEGAQDAPRSA